MNNLAFGVGLGSSPTPGLTAHTFRSPRHTTHYWGVGPADAPLMIFLHGWPQIGLMWRAQMEALASDGWRCIAPDMRGYGGSSAPASQQAYALKEIVEDMVELHDHLGASPAIWIGHDLGSPVAGALAAHHPKRCRGVVFVSVPYSPESFTLPSLLPLIDRKVYPADQYPDGQWDYYHFYLDPLRTDGKRLRRRHRSNALSYLSSRRPEVRRHRVSLRLDHPQWWLVRLRPPRTIDPAGS